MAELSVSHSLRATEHYLHFNPLVRPLKRKSFKKKSLAWQGWDQVPASGADPAPVGQGCLGLLWDEQLCKGGPRSPSCSVSLWLLAAALRAVLL